MLAPDKFRPTPVVLVILLEITCVECKIFVVLECRKMYIPMHVLVWHPRGDMQMRDHGFDQHKISRIMARYVKLELDPVGSGIGRPREPGPMVWQQTGQSPVQNLVTEYWSLRVLYKPVVKLPGLIP